jgi:ribosomal RNA-processing protein 12
MKRWLFLCHTIVARCLRFEQLPATKPAAGDAFEDVLYGSESELDDSDEEPSAEPSKTQTKRRGKDAGARLRVDDDEPMDLLQGAASRITGT